MCMYKVRNHPDIHKIAECITEAVGDVDKTWIQRKKTILDLLNKLVPTVKIKMKAIFHG